MILVLRVDDGDASVDVDVSRWPGQGGGAELFLGDCVVLVLMLTMMMTVLLIFVDGADTDTDTRYLFCIGVDIDVCHCLSPPVASFLSSTTILPFRSAELSRGCSATSAGWMGGAGRRSGGFAMSRSLSRSTSGC